MEEEEGAKENSDWRRQMMQRKIVQVENRKLGMVVAEDGGKGWWQRVVAEGGGKGSWQRAVAKSVEKGWWRKKRTCTSEKKGTYKKQAT